MPALNDSFDQYITVINPDDDAIRYAQKAHEPIREYLEKECYFSGHVEDTFLYGSYARETAVGDIKDVDIVVLTDFNPALDSDSPDKVLKKLKMALDKHYGDPDNTDYQHRSIRVNDPLPDNPDIEMTLDIIPAVARNGKDGPLLVPDKDLKEWIPSHPKGHMEYTKKLNKMSGEQFVPLAKIMKSWWKYQCSVEQPKVERPKPNGFWVEMLTSVCFDPNLRLWSDHFVKVLENTVGQYGVADQVPELEDPGLPGRTIKTSMTPEEFKKFVEITSKSLEIAKRAYGEKDPENGAILWRKVFGEDFGRESAQKVIGVRSVSSPKKDFQRQWSE